MNAAITPITLIVLVALCPGITLLCMACALTVLRSQGLRWSWQRAVCSSPMRYKHLRFTIGRSDDGQVLQALRVLERHGFALVSEARTRWDGGFVVTRRKAV